jgi:Domain of unknown function (DUF929)
VGRLKSQGKSFDISKQEVWEAFGQVKANQGAPGVDGQSIAGFEADLKNNLYRIWNRMSPGTYFPPPVRAVEIPKQHGGGTRMLGIATVEGGKPGMLYIGAEFCPYCAELRWSMAVALSRFGGFITPLRGIHSSASDVFPHTATLTFYQSRYTSRYLAFTPVENEKVDRSPLRPTTAQQQALWDKYDANSYPFIDVGNKYDVTEPMYDPQVLQGKTLAQIASALHNPPSPIAQGALGATNYITAAICKTTGGRPSNVCSSQAITRLEPKL